MMRARSDCGGGQKAIEEKRVEKPKKPKKPNKVEKPKRMTEGGARASLWESDSGVVVAGHSAS